MKIKEGCVFPECKLGCTLLQASVPQLLNLLETVSEICEVDIDVKYHLGYVFITYMHVRKTDRQLVHLMVQDAAWCQA